MAKNKEFTKESIAEFLEKNTTAEDRRLYRAVSALSSIVTEGCCTIPSLVEHLYSRFEKAGRQSESKVNNLELSRGEIARQLRSDGLLDYLENEHFIEIHKDDILVTGAGLAVGWRMYILFITNKEFSLGEVATIINTALRVTYNKDLDTREKFNQEEILSIKNTLEAMMFKPQVTH